MPESSAAAQNSNFSLARNPISPVSGMWVGLGSLPVDCDSKKAFGTYSYIVDFQHAELLWLPDAVSSICRLERDASAVVYSPANWRAFAYLEQPAS